MPSLTFCIRYARPNETVTPLEPSLYQAVGLPGLRLSVGSCNEFRARETCHHSDAYRATHFDSAAHDCELTTYDNALMQPDPVGLMGVPAQRLEPWTTALLHHVRHSAH